MITATTDHMRRTAAKQLPQQSWIAQWQNEFRAGIAEYVLSAIMTNLPGLQEEKIDDMADGFMSQSPAVRGESTAEIARLLRSTGIDHCVKTADTIEKLQTILHDTDLQTNMALYFHHNKSGEITKLFDAERFSDHTRGVLKPMCHRTTFRCDSTKFELAASLHVPDDHFGYTPQKPVISATPGAVNDASFVTAATQLLRHRAYTTYIAAGGKLVRQDVLETIVANQILNHMKAFLDARFPTTQYGDLGNNLMGEFTATNATTQDPNENGIERAIRSFMVPDYDACRIGASNIAGELSRRAGLASVIGKEHKMLRQLTADLKLVEILHSIYHNPAAIAALGNYCRTNNNNDSENSDVRRFQVRLPEKIAQLKSAIRAAISDPNQTKSITKQLDLQYRQDEAAERAGIRAREQMPQSPVAMVIAHFFGARQY